MSTKIKDGKIEIEINKIKVKVLYTIEVGEDDIPVKSNIDFETEEEEKEYLQKFENGYYCNVYISVKAFAEGEEGGDCLGGCHIKTNNFEENIMEIVKKYSMVNEAISDLKINIINQARNLRKFTE